MFGSASATKRGSTPRVRLRTALRTPAATTLAGLLSLGAVLALPGTASAAPGDLRITDVTGVEGDTLVFELRREAGGAGARTLTYSVLAGTATAGADYTAVSGSVTFADNTGGTNDQIQRISVPTLQDVLDEVDETFTLQVLNSDGTPAISGRGAIRDDDASPTYTLTTAPDPAGEGVGTVAVTATLSEVSGRNVTIPVSSANGTAVAGQDYTAIAGGTSIVIAAGSLTGSTTVAITDDALDEVDVQTFTVDGASTGAEGVSGTASATVGITDNDAMPTVAIGGAGAAMEGGNLTFPVTLSAASERTVTVMANTVSDTAEAGADYTQVLNSVVSFAPGTTSTSVVVTTLGDTLDEVDPETVRVVLSDPTNGVLATPASASGAINDDDLPPTVTLAPTTVTEGDTGITPATFTATLSAPSGRTVEVGYTVGAGTATAGEDYTATTGTLTFAPGTTVQTFVLDVLGDRLDEGASETVDVTLSNTGGTVGIGGSLGTTTVTITDDDAAPTFSMGDVTVTEGDSGLASATLTVELSNPSTQAISFDVSSADGTAVEVGTGAGSNDYDLPAGTLTIAPGTTSGTVTVPINSDTVYEGNETFTVTAALAVGETDATGAPDSATVTVADDDPLPRVVFSSESGTEGTNATVVATVTGTAQASTALNVSVLGASVNGSDPAEASDFVNPGASVLNIPAGTTSGTVLPVTTFAYGNDLIDEPVETVVVSASVATGFADVVNGVQSINDDPGDVAPSISLADVTVAEGAGVAAVPVALAFEGATTSTEQTVVVRVTTVDGSAVAGRDYTARTASVNLLPGTTSSVFTVPVLDDAVDEANQTFGVRVTSRRPAEAPIAVGTATVTITDDDAAAAPTISAPAQRRGKGAVAITGTAREGATVTLYARPFGSAESSVGTVTADAAGRYTFTQTIAKETTFRVRVAGFNSNATTVSVREAPALAASSPRAGVVYLGVRSNPSLAGVPVRVYRVTSAGRTAIASGITDANGVFRATLYRQRAGTATYQALVSGNYSSTGVLSGYSNRRTITVR